LKDNGTNLRPFGLYRRHRILTGSTAEADGLVPSKGGITTGWELEESVLLTLPRRLEKVALFTFFAFKEVYHRALDSRSLDV